MPMPRVMVLTNQQAWQGPIDIPMENPLTAFDWYGAAWAEDPLWTPPSVAYTSADGLVLPGTAGNYASVPDEAALDITGDITLLVGARLTSWASGAIQSLIMKRQAVGQASYGLRLAATGIPELLYSTDGTTVLGISATTAAPFAAGEHGYLAVSFDVDDGAGNKVTKFWTSTDLITWTQLGTTQTNAGTVTLYSSTSILEFGSVFAGTTQNIAGNLSVARVYSGSGFSAAGPSGSLVLDADFRRARTSSFTAATGQTVTISSGAAVSSWRNGGTLGTAFEQSTGAAQPTFRSAVAALNNRPAVDFDGTDDRLEITSGVSLAQPFSVVWIGTYDALTSARAVVGLNSASLNYRVGTNATPNFSINATTALNGGTPVAGVGYMQRSYVNGASSAISVNGTSQASGNAGASALDQIILGTGRTAPSTYGNFHDGPTAFIGIIAGDITTHANWPAFKRWVASRYGITVA